MFDIDEKSINTSKPKLFPKVSQKYQTSSTITLSPSPTLKRKMLNVVVAVATPVNSRVFSVNARYAQPIEMNWRTRISPMLVDSTFEAAREVRLSVLKYDNNVLRINNGKSIIAKLSFDPERVIAYSDEYPVYGFGDSLEAALKDFQQSFIDFFLNVTECSEDLLDKQSQELRNQLNTFATLEING